jgi:hypothetical protein
MWIDAYDRRDDEGRPLRAGRRLHHGRRAGTGAGRRLRQLLEALRHRGGQPAGSGSRHGRRPGPHRQRAHEPDLFWAIKGGGGGTFGVVTRMTLRTHELPEYFGGVFGEITPAAMTRLQAPWSRASSPSTAKRLFNPHWGEQVSLRDGRQLHLSMVFQGLDRAQAQAVWAPFLDWVRASGTTRSRADHHGGAGAPLLGRRFLEQGRARHHGEGRPRRRAGPPRRVAGRPRPGRLVHPRLRIGLAAGRLLEEGARRGWWTACARPADKWWVELHFNKGIAGAPPEALEPRAPPPPIPAWTRSRWRSSPAAAIRLTRACRARSPTRPGPTGAPSAIRSAMDALRKVAPDAGAYVSESDFLPAALAGCLLGPQLRASS